MDAVEKAIVSELLNAFKRLVNAQERMAIDLGRVADAIALEKAETVVLDEESGD